MNEESIREAFRYGAGEAEPGAGMWERVERETRVRSRTGLRWVLRRGALAAGILLLLATATVALSPTARAVVAKTVQGMVIIWEGRVGKTEGVLGWTDSRVGQEQLEEQGIHIVTDPMINFGNTLETARALGFAPAEAHDATAVLTQVQGRRMAMGEHEVRLALLAYKVDGGPAPYLVGTTADGVMEQGVWVHRPYQGVDALQVTPVAPTAQETVSLGNDRSALCYKPDPALADTACTFLQEGRSISVIGPDREVVIRLARSVTAGTP